MKLVLFSTHLFVSWYTSFAFVPQRKLDSTVPFLSEKKISSFEDTDAASQGLVSSLTALVNSLSPSNRASESEGAKERSPPESPEELYDRIRDDYVVKNYLWTGDLDLDCFDSACRFTDPTISFQGTATFKENTANLVKLVEAFVQNYQSTLLDIQLHPEFVETRWNMVGELNGLFWKPKIDVIGRTKFWYRQDDEVLQVFEYDEKWEIPAYQALLQLVSPAGTFPNTTLTPQ
jgi:hypothetical protein